MANLGIGLFWLMIAIVGASVCLGIYFTWKSIINMDRQNNVDMLLKIFDLGIDLFGSYEAFKEWLDEENLFFDKTQPKRFLVDKNGLKYLHDRLIGMQIGDNA